MNARVTGSFQCRAISGDFVDLTCAKDIRCTKVNGEVPRYHFNLHDHRYVPDPEGSDLPNLEHAKRQAIKLAAAILLNCPDEFLSSKEWRVEVTDPSGVLHFTVGLAVSHAPKAWSPAGYGL